MKKAAIAALLVLIGAGGWMAVDKLMNNGGNPGGQQQVSQTGNRTSDGDGKEVIMSEDQLRTLATTHAPLYWAGPRDGTQYGVTVTSHNGVFIRYIPTGDAAGSTKEYLSVATYYALNGYNALASAKKDSADAAKSDTGALIATFKDKPNHTYFSFPNAAFQVEVFSPDGNQARSMVDNGEIRLLDPKTNT